MVIFEDSPVNEKKNGESSTATDDDTNQDSTEEEELCVDYPSGKLAAMTRKRNEILKFLKIKTDNTVGKVKLLLSSFQQKIKKFEEACSLQFKKVGIAGDIMLEFSNWYEQHMKINSEFEEKVILWLNGGDDENVLQSSVQLEDNISIPNNELDAIDRSNRLKELQEKEAQAQVYFEKQQMELKKKFEDYKSDIQTQSAEILKQSVNGHEKSFPPTTSQIDDACFLKDWENESLAQEKTENKMISGENFSLNDIILKQHQALTKQNDISLMLAQAQARALLPTTEPEIFDASDPTEYKSFVLSFDRTIVQRTSDDADRYYYLMKYTKGPPQELVKSCNYNDPSKAYNVARKLLEENYGNEFVIANQYLEKLEKWKHIASEDSKALNELSLFLTRCSAMMHNMSALNQLNSLKEIRDIVKKLPYELRKRYRDVAGAQLQAGKQITFQHLVDFVNKQARLLMIPILGDIRDDDRKQKRPLHKKVFCTAVSNDDGQDFAVTDNKAFSSCPCCNKKNHKLDNCFFFLKKTLPQREEFVRSRKLCFGCLMPNHVSRFCNCKIVCKKCQKKHPTSLHKTQYESTSSLQEKSDDKTNLAKNETSKTDLVVEATVHHIKINKNSQKLVYPSVLVNVRFQGQAEVVRTYMGLDPYCSDAFIDEQLVKEMNGKGEPVEVALTTMEHNKSTVNYTKVKNIEILSLDCTTKAIIDKAYAKKDWPFTCEDSPSSKDVAGYSVLEKIPINYANKRIGLLVGINEPDIIKPLDIVNTTRRGPYATKHLFGWSINGPVTNSGLNKTTCFHVKVEKENDLSIEEKFESCFARDFDDDNEEIGLSVNDKKFTEKVQKSIIKLPNNHFQIDLPFKDNNIILPCNYDQAYQRLNCIKKRLDRDPGYCNEYKDFMKSMRESGFAERVPDSEIETKSGKVWYLTHFAVRHKQKNKLRIVFDCSLKYKNISLNDVLLQGPDLTNNLVGVLLRFREMTVAFSADIKSMFYQVRTPVEDSNFLRFLWYPNDDLNKKPEQYRLLVHVFGAKSSPSCANFALRYIAECPANNVSEDVRYCILKSFYVDDILKSCMSEKIAIDVAKKIIAILAENGFNLTGFVSNSRALLNSLPPEKLSKDFMDLDLFRDQLPFEKALGVVWNTQNDTFGFRIGTVSSSCTKRGILSTLFSIYDPLFIVSPVIITGKKIFQEACSMKLKWDEQLDKNLTTQWQKWISELHLLGTYELPRCYSGNMQNIRHLQLHIFCDGSMIAYGAVAYLRFEDHFGAVYCSIVMAKARLTPLNRASLKTVPRIELNAAKIAVSLQQRISTELEIKIDRVFFWSDSTVVLNYIKSDHGRFQVYVANRIAYIRSKSAVDQWNHVPGNLNPADLLSRGSKNISEFIRNNEWKEGPAFLKNDESCWPSLSITGDIPLDDLELKKIKTFATQIAPDATMKLLESSSNWFKIRCRIAYMLRLKDQFRKKVFKKGRLSLEELQVAEVAIWRYLQQTQLAEVLKTLASNKALGRNHTLSKLNPFIDKDGIIRVGGRLKNASVPDDAKYPIILPKSPLVVRLLCEDVHRKLGHLGRECMMAQLRQTVYIIGGTMLIKDVLRKCIICRKLHARPSEQLMADLPSDRLQSDLPPFSSTGTDYFGPILVSHGRGRAQVKRYGVLFTCMASRAMHIEVAYSLDTDSFLNALRRFVSRRGPIKILRSDQGTNYVAGNKELKNSLQQWNQNQIDDWCKAQNIEWKFNPPSAPHFGGIWEREIKSIKKILQGLTSEFSNQTVMTDEMLATLLCEIENILNSRPLTAVSSDVNDLQALTPNHLLRLNFGISFPPGLFSRDDMYLRRRWRQVQHMAEVFWTRWRREYLPLLMERQKWRLVRRSHEEGDLVLIVDQLLPRNLWCTGRIVQIQRDDKGHVRSARVQVSRHKNGRDLHIGIAYLERPIAKLILLRTAEEL